MINHLSVGVCDPKIAAENLAKLVGGSFGTFPPLDGAYVCFLSKDKWSGSFIEFYPRGVALTATSSGVKFSHFDDSTYVNATHINISVGKSPHDISKIATHLGLKHGPRGKMGIYDVWLEEQFLVELVDDK